MTRVVALTAAGVSMLLLTGCSSTSPLPPYETPLAKTHIQSVRTTAFTHTESDHLAYGNQNALGGTLHAAAMPDPRTAAGPNVATFERGAGSTPQGLDHPEEGGFHPASNIPAARVDSPPAAPMVPTTGVGSAAADWSRWPAGTVFRILATGQVYEVDDYGWALAGRNTIDLYEPTRAAMNAWGARHVDIEILRWGDPAGSLRKLEHHQEYRHIRRMVYELEGRAHDAAALE